MENNIKIGLKIQENGDLGLLVNDSKKLYKNLTEAAKARIKTGAAEEVKDVKALNAALEKTQKASAGVAGKVMSKMGPSAAYKAESQDYGRVRGAVGTGASGRDFAKQSEGLGGLVRLYATYAANVFAVGAAFTALSNAMDTTNMVQGLNQLGAASGVAMGNLAKDFAKASGGAISLRDSMESTAKAVSSGLSQEQFMKLGMVAKNASQALGVNMADAVSRLTRGITKLEPELLDELGIFTKVGKATEDYAKKVGKSVTALSDFERRQAFANAVLAEGIEKFGEIDLPTNPYSELLASLKDMSQSILEVVNVALTPMVKLLADSPTGLATAMAAVAAIITKQAIPAIGEWRANINEMESKSYDRLVERRSKSLVAKQSLDKDALLRAESVADQAVDRREYLETRLGLKEDLGANKLFKSGEANRLGKIAKASAFDYRDSEKEKAESGNKNFESLLDKDLKYMDAKMAKLEGKTDIASKSQLEYIKALKKNTLESIAAEEKYIQVLEDKKKENAKLSSERTVMTASGRANIMLDRQENTFARKSVTRKAADDTESLGALTAYQLLNKNISEEKAKSKQAGGSFGPMQAGLTRLSGAFAIATTAVTSFISAMSIYIMVIGAAIAAIALIVNALSDNQKEMAIYNEAIDKLNESTEAAERTNRKYAESITISGLTAQATGIDGLAASLEEVAKAYEKADAKTNNWVERSAEWAKDFFGFGMDDKLADSTAASVEQFIASIADPVRKAEASIDVAKIFNVKDVKEITENALDALDPKVLQKRQKEFSALAKAQAKAMQESYAPLNDLRKSLQQAGTDFDAISNSFNSTDPFVKLSLSAAKASQGLKDASKDLTKFEAIAKDLASDRSNNIKLFGVEGGNELTNAAQRVVDTEKERKRLAEERLEIESKIALLTSDIKREESSAAYAQNDPKSTFTAAALRAELTKLTAGQASVVGRLNTLNKEVANTVSLANTLAGKRIQASYDAITSRPNTVAAQGSIELQKTLISKIGENVLTVKLSADLERQSLSLRAKEINALAQVANALDRNTVMEEKSTAQQVVTDLQWQKRMVQMTVPDTDPNKAANLKTLDDKILEARKPVDLADAKLRQLAGKGTKEDVATMRAAADQQGLQILARMQETNKQLQDIKNQQKMVDLNEAVKRYDVTRKDGTSTEGGETDLKGAVTMLETALANLPKTDMFLQASGDEQAELTRAYTEQVQVAQEVLAKYQFDTSMGILESLRNEATKLFGENSSIVKDITAATVLEGQKNIQAYVTATETTKQTNATNAGFAAKEANYEKVVRQKDLELGIAERLSLTEKTRLEIQLENISNSELILSKQVELGGVSADFADKKKTQLEAEKLAVETLIKLEDLRLKKLQAQLKAEKDLANPKNASTEARAKIVSDRDTEVAKIDAETEAVNRYKAAQDSVRNEYPNLTEKGKAYVDVMTKGIDGMADAFVEFAKTGKLSFSDMAESILADLLRIEIKTQMMNMINAASDGKGIGGLLSKFIPGVFGAGSSGGVTMPSAGDYSTIYNPELYINAKGNAFSGTIEKFAKGGTFTNSIVSSPTMFKFAKGTGLMGEAGPEAIMPLTRDNSGNLGVRAPNGSSGQNVDIQINNYSSEKAEAKETTDSNGNRRIEVTIGEMVASEMSRPNSPLQTGMRQTYGQAPQLVRR